MIILVGGEKGGTGKTTLATNLAAMRAHAGHDVLLVDTDPQGSGSYWSQTRDEEEIKPRVPTIQKFGKSLQTEVKDLAKRYGDIIIDAGGRESAELRAALVVIHKAYVPIQASQFDVWTLGRMDTLIATAQGFNPEMKAWVILNRISPNPAVTETAEAQELMKDFGNLTLAKSSVVDRIAYRKAARAGRSVLELPHSDPKANNEMESFYAEVFKNV